MYIISHLGGRYVDNIKYSWSVKQQAQKITGSYLLKVRDPNLRHGESSAVKFESTTTIIGQITNNDEKSYQEEINNLAGWCTENNLLLIVNKIKALIVDFEIGGKDTHPCLRQRRWGGAGEQF